MLDAATSQKGRNKKGDFFFQLEKAESFLLPRIDTKAKDKEQKTHPPPHAWIITLFLTK
jgi:hypothetical protein